jgi:sec-independent protein translocase protein TatC
MSIRPIGHEDRLSLVDHLDELRSRLIVCVMALLVSCAFCYWQNDRVLDIVNRPLEQTRDATSKKRSDDPLEQTQRFQLALGSALKKLAPALDETAASIDSLGDSAALTPAQALVLQQRNRSLQLAAAQVKAAAAQVPTNTGRQPVTLGVAEPFVTTMTVTLYAGLLLALPLILYQAYAFLLPAFKPQERRLAISVMGMVPVLFVAGVTFGYFVALPRAVDFLQNFNDDAFDILIQAKDYYRFILLFLLMTGLVFQIPVAVLAVTRLGIVSTRVLRASRGYALLAIAVVAAVITPTPDPVTMLVTMAPMIVLYELSVQIARLVEPAAGTRRGWWNADDDEDDDDLD